MGGCSAPFRLGAKRLRRPKHAAAVDTLRARTRGRGPCVAPPISEEGPSTQQRRHETWGRGAGDKFGKPGGAMWCAERGAVLVQGGRSKGGRRGRPRIEGFLILLAARRAAVVAAVPDEERGGAKTSPPFDPIGAMTAHRNRICASLSVSKGGEGPLI